MKWLGKAVEISYYGGEEDGDDDDERRWSRFGGDLLNPGRRSNLGEVTFWEERLISDLNPICLRDESMRSKDGSTE